jgi:RNA polymerase sigma-70 factor (ECF subfamily)
MIDSVEKAISAWNIQGDQSAATWLVHEHRGLVLSAARRWGVPEEMEQDAVQEVFVRVFNSLHLFRPEKPFAHWLNVITRNTCSKIRRYWCQRFRLSAVFEGAAEDIADLDVPHSSSPDVQADIRDRARALERVLLGLSSQEQDLFAQLWHDERALAPPAGGPAPSNGAIRAARHRLRRKLQAGLSLQFGS